jgi:hypothetical protein
VIAPTLGRIAASRCGGRSGRRARLRGDLREIERVSDIALAQHGGAEQHILKLADIARPVMPASEAPAPRA